MQVEVVSTPKLLLPEHLADRVVVVLDVLRATTTMIAALDAGARRIHVFADLEETRRAAGACSDAKILCGERRALPPEGFDMGNSPGDFTSARCGDRTLFMTTTNGTPAIAAAAGGREVLIGAVVNCSAVARRLINDWKQHNSPATILCAGQRGDVALEDLLGAGAILDAIRASGEKVEHVNDTSILSLDLFDLHRDNLGRVFRMCRGARSEMNLGLEADIDFCAVADRFKVIGALNKSRAAENQFAIDRLPGSL